MSTWIANKIVAWLLNDAKRLGNFAASQASLAQVQVDGIASQLKLTGAWDPEQLAALQARIRIQRARLAAAKSIMMWLSQDPLATPAAPGESVSVSGAPLAPAAAAAASPLATAVLTDPPAPSQATQVAAAAPASPMQAARTNA